MTVKKPKRENGGRVLIEKPNGEASPSAQHRGGGNRRNLGAMAGFSNKILTGSVIPKHTAHSSALVSRSLRKAWQMSKTRVNRKELKKTCPFLLMFCFKLQQYSPPLQPPRSGCFFTLCQEGLRHTLCYTLVTQKTSFQITASIRRLASTRRNGTHVACLRDVVSR